MEFGWHHEWTGLQSWSDPAGHSTLCAVIAAGRRKDGGRFNGVAPEAGVIACRTRFFDSELSAIYDHLTRLLASDPGLRLVVTNSFGRRHGLPPPAKTDSDFLPALEDIIEAGAAVLFSAGNNHQLAGGHPEHCHPKTIWGYKLKQDLRTVGACDLEGRLWHYSSRGPGIQNGPAPSPTSSPPCPATVSPPAARKTAASPKAGGPLEPAPKPPAWQPSYGPRSRSRRQRESSSGCGEERETWEEPGPARVRVPGLRRGDVYQRSQGQDRILKEV